MITYFNFIWDGTRINMPTPLEENPVEMVIIQSIDTVKSAYQILGCFQVDINYIICLISGINGYSK
jgi:hypothetical protein